MNLFTATLIVVAVAILSLGAMWWAWRKRSQRSAAIQLPEQTGTLVETFERIFYVATTPAGEPLMRVNVPSLIYRGYASVSVHSAGVTVQVRGENAVTIPARSITSTSSARTRIDKAVERDGLAILSWVWGDKQFESSLRFPTASDQHAFHDAVSSIIPHEIKEDA
ncbi:MAG: PH-like domain-containing protein [Canibacter sp.]